MSKFFAYTFMLYIFMSYAHVALAEYKYISICKKYGWNSIACIKEIKKIPKPKPIEKINICSKSFHANDVINNKGCTIYAKQPRLSDVEMFVQLMGLNNISKINEMAFHIYAYDNLKNAVASFDDKKGRIIVYDPLWLKAGGLSASLVLAHEAGHHFCNHVIENNELDTIRDELEADEFSGAAIKRLESYYQEKYIDDVIRIANNIFPENGTYTHPPRKDRIAAILRGYEKGSICGNLKPGIPGYVRKPIERY